LTSGSNGFVVAAGPPCGTVRAVPCARPGGGRSLGSKPSSAGGGGAHIGEPRKFTTNCDGSIRGRGCPVCAPFNVGCAGWVWCVQVLGECGLVPRCSIPY